MAELKTATEKAMHYKREAYIERVCKDPPVLAPMWDREAAKALALPQTPDVGAGGEVVREQTTGRGGNRSYVRETLKQGATQISEDASIQRTDLLMQPNVEVVAMGIDAAESINAEGSLEKMLAHQLAMAHEIAMRFADRALSFEHKRAGDQVEACRCATTSARLMTAFQSGMLALHKLRTGGNQTVTVQHVNVQPGAQAVIGNVRTGGHGDGGTDGK